MLETAVHELKQEIWARDGSNAANASFAKRVNDLISVFYDDIGEITTVSTHTLFDLFVIKVLYVGRRSTDAGVVDYLGRLLDRYLYTRELFPAADDGGVSLVYLSDLLREMQQNSHFQNLFEAYRKYGDNALFVTGMFPRALRPRRRNRRIAAAAFVDRSYYVSTGKQSYHLAAQHELAEATQQRDLLEKLSSYFEIYLDALNEMSERYIMGLDFQLIADKMLDAFNEYRRSGEERFLQSACRYAAVLRLDPAVFPGPRS